MAIDSYIRAARGHLVDKRLSAEEAEAKRRQEAEMIDTAMCGPQAKMASH